MTERWNNRRQLYGKAQVNYSAQFGKHTVGEKYAERPGCPGTREQAYKRKRRPVSSLKVSFRPRRYEKCPSAEPAGILLSDAGISAIPRQNTYTQVSSFRAAACPAYGSEDVFCMSPGNRSPSGFLPPGAQITALPCFSGFIPVFFRQLPKNCLLKEYLLPPAEQGKQF